jgi:hypothetical protein
MSRKPILHPVYAIEYLYVCEVSKETFTTKHVFSVVLARTTFFHYFTLARIHQRQLKLTVG